MSETMRFADGFPTPSYEQWVAEVEKALKGAPFDKRMFTKTYEGITLRPIYTRQDWPADGDPSGFPGAMPFTRGGRAAGNRDGDWDVRQCYGHPDLAKGNEIILNELTRGVTSLHIHFDQAACAGLDADSAGAEALAGVDGAMVYSADDLDRLLTGVHLDLAPVALKAGGQFVAAAALLMALWTRRRIKPEAALGAFGADPLGTLAASGALPTSLDDACRQMALLAKHTAATYPQVTAVAVEHRALPQRRLHREPGSGDLDGHGGALPEGDARRRHGYRQRLQAAPVHLLGAVRSVPRHRQAARRAQVVLARSPKPAVRRSRPGR